MEYRKSLGIWWSIMGVIRVISFSRTGIVIWWRVSLRHARFDSVRLVFSVKYVVIIRVARSHTSKQKSCLFANCRLCAARGRSARPSHMVFVTSIRESARAFSRAFYVVHFRKLLALNKILWRRGAARRDTPYVSSRIAKTNEQTNKQTRKQKRTRFKFLNVIYIY